MNDGCSGSSAQAQKKQDGSIGAANAARATERTSRRRTPAIDSIPARMLSADLTCPVCLSVINEAWTVKECLHRFCRECIEMSLRLGRKQCPSCRCACPSRRSLRPDLHFDAIVKAIFPDLTLLEQEDEKRVKQAIESHNHLALARNVELAARKQHAKRSRGSVAAAAASVSANVTSSTANQRRRQSSQALLFRTPRHAARRRRRPIAVCLERARDGDDASVRTGPCVRLFVSLPRSSSLRQVAAYIRDRFHIPARLDIRILARTADDSQKNSGLLDLDNRVDALDYHFVGDDATRTLVLVYDTVVARR